MFKILIQSIPNLITSLNLLSGLVAIFFGFHPLTEYGALAGWQCAAIAILAASVFDFLDGASARVLGAYSTLGKELDSLADLVSFGVAPAMLLMNTLLEVTAGHWISYLALLIPVMGAFRLAKFNIDTTQTTTFSGLPIPANALFWIGFTGMIFSHGICPAVPWLFLIIVGESVLMVSRVRMFSLKFTNFNLKENFRRYVIVLAAIVSVALYGFEGFLWTIILYVLISVLRRQ